MKNRLPFLLLFCLAAAACDDTGTTAPASSDAGPSGTVSGGGSAASGGGGDVAIGQTDNDRTTIADRYRNALELIRKRDWDGARAQLVEAIQRTPDPALRKEMQQHLKIVEQGILEQPAYPVPTVFAHANQLYEKTVSMRGKFITGGASGKVNYYFWLESGRKMQIRYSQLTLDDKKRVAQLTEGSQLLVRGILKSPWGSNPNPYLEATFLRVERWAPAPAAAEAAP